MCPHPEWQLTVEPSALEDSFSGPSHPDANNTPTPIPSPPSTPIPTTNGLPVPS